MVSSLRPKLLENHLIEVDDLKEREEVIEATNTALFDSNVITEDQEIQLREIFSISERETIHEAVMNTNINELEELFELMHQAFTQDSNILITALNKNENDKKKKDFISVILQQNFRNQEMLTALRDACKFSKEMNMKIKKQAITSTIMKLAEELLEGGIVMEDALNIPLTKINKAINSPTNKHIKQI